MRSGLFFDERFCSPPDLLRVGRLKAVGYLSVAENGTLPIAPICRILRQRGISLRLLHPKSKHHYRKATTALLRQLPPIQVSSRRQIPAYVRPGTDEAALYAYDEEVLSELLACNAEFLRGYPASPEAFIELIYFVSFSYGCDVTRLIELAFGAHSPGLLYEPAARKPFCGRIHWQVICPHGRPTQGLRSVGYYKALWWAQDRASEDCDEEACPQGKHTVQMVLNGEQLVRLA